MTEPKVSGVSRRLKILRESNGLSLRELAEQTGLSFMTIARVEKSRNPQIETVYKLARALGVEIGDLIEPERKAQPRPKRPGRSVGRRSSANPANRTRGA